MLRCAVDADMDVTDRSFSMGRLLRDMRISNVSLAQPRIKEARKVCGHQLTSADISCHQLSSIDINRHLAVISHAPTGARQAGAHTQRRTHQKA